MVDNWLWVVYAVKTMLAHIPLINTILNDIDNEARLHGFQKAAQGIVRRLHLKVAIQGLSPATLDILKSGRVVIVANHPSDFSVLSLLSSLPDRKDAYLIINRRFIGIFPHIDPSLIPVYVDHHVHSKLHVKLFGSLYRSLNPKPHLTAEEEHTLNIQSIKDASDRVNEGGLVVVFPGFPEEKELNSHWFSGIGHLLSRVEDKDTHIVRAYIQEPKYAKLLRILSLLGIHTSRIIVHFAEPVYLHDVNDQNPKKTTQDLEMRYKTWIHTRDSIF